MIWLKCTVNPAASLYVRVNLAYVLRFAPFQHSDSTYRIQVVVTDNATLYLDASYANRAAAEAAIDAYIGVLGLR